MEERDQEAKLQPARSAPPVPIGGPVRSAPARPPGDIVRSRPRPSSTGPGPLKTQDNTNGGRPQITIVSARPMSEVNFSGSKLPDPSVKPVDRNGSIPSNANELPANMNAPPSLPMTRPKGNYVPPPLPTSRPKGTYTPPIQTKSIRSSSVSSQSSSSQAVSPTEQMSQEQSKNDSAAVGSELPKELTAKKSEPPKRPTSGPRFPNPSPSPSSAANSPIEVSSSESVNPTPRPRIRSVSEKCQSGKETVPDDLSSVKKAEDSTPSAPPPLPTSRPSRKYTVVRPTSIEPTKASEKADNVNSIRSKDTTSNKSDSTPTPTERQTAVGELGKALEANQKPVPPHTAVKPPKPTTKPVQQPKPTPKPTASVAFPPPPSSPKSEHKFNSPLARPRPRVTNTNSEESSEVNDSHKDSNSSVVVPSAISVTAAIKGINSKISAKPNNSIKSSTNRTASPVNTEKPKPTVPENTSQSSKNPFSLAKPTLNRASPSSETSASADKGSSTRMAQPVPTPRGMQNSATIDANTISTAAKGLSAFSSTMSSFENQPKPQGQSSRPPPPKWNGQVPDAATLSLAASGVSAMSSVAASASKFQSKVDRQQSSTNKTSAPQPTPSIPDAATISATAKGLSFLSSVSSSQSRPVPTARAPSSFQNTSKTSVSQPARSIPDAATISAAAEGLSFFSSVSSSQSRPVPAARVPPSSQNTMSTSVSLNSLNQKPLIPQKTSQINAPSQSVMKDIASMFDPIATTAKPQQEKTPASRDSDLLLAFGGSQVTAPTRKAPSIPKSKQRASPTPTSKQTSTPPVNKTSNTNTSLLQPKAAVRPTIIRPSAKPSNKKKAPPRPTTGPNLKNMKSKAAPRQPMQASAMRNSKKPNAKTKRPAPVRPGPPPTAVVSGLPPRPGPGHPLFKYTVEKPHGIAQFSFQGTNIDELSFEENDVIILLREVNADWFCGRNKDKEGIFPKNFVKIIKPLTGQEKEKEKEKEIEEISGPCAVALHAYRSDAADDLCFDAGDNIRLLEKMNDQWYKGECNGNTGMFPKNFVEVIEDIPESVQIKVDSPVSAGSGPRCKARFDYESDEPSDLTFVEGAIIKLVARVGDEWLRGELSGRTGIFPQAYVEIIEDLGPDNDDGIVTALFDFDGADSSELSFKTGDKILVKSQINNEWLVGELNGNEGSFPANFVDNIPANLPSAANSPSNVPSDDANQGTCTAVFDFDAGDDDELSIRTGDTITIVEAVGDDWLRGRLNGKEGIFPRNFVEMQEGGSGAKLTVKALFDFPAKMHDDLGFQVNDIITDVVSVSDDWYEGSLNGKVGRFPSNFVEVIST